MQAKAAMVRLLAALALNGFVVAAGQGAEPDPGATISESQAREIAWRAGLVHGEEITRSDDRWEIAGRSLDDGEMVLDIDIRNGRILD